MTLRYSIPSMEQLRLVLEMQLSLAMELETAGRE